LGRLLGGVHVRPAGKHCYLVSVFDRPDRGCKNRGSMNEPDDLSDILIGQKASYPTRLKIERKALGPGFRVWDKNGRDIQSDRRDREAAKLGREWTSRRRGPSSGTRQTLLPAMGVKKSRGRLFQKWTKREREAYDRRIWGGGRSEGRISSTEG